MKEHVTQIINTQRYALFVRKKQGQTPTCYKITVNHQKYTLLLLDPLTF